MSALKPAGNTAEERALLAHASFDGELDPVNALSVGRDIAADPQLVAEVRRIDALRHAVRERFPIEPIPDRLRARIDAAIGPAAASRPSWRSLAASVALALLVGSGATWTALTTQSANDRAVAAIVDGHLRSLMSQRPTDVASSETHTVKPWFNGRTTHAPTVIDLSKEGFPLLGGRVDVVGTEPVPTLVYSRRKHLISLFALPRASHGERSATTRTVKGYNLVEWTANGVDYWAASDLNPVELQQFAQLFHRAAAR
jgi:anti-sigma factor RsiW